MFNLRHIIDQQRRQMQIPGGDTFSIDIVIYALNLSRFEANGWRHNFRQNLLSGFCFMLVFFRQDLRDL